MLRFAPLALGLFLATAVHASCPQQKVQSGAILALQIPYDESGCWVSLSQADKPDLVFRDYLFNEKGLLMVFNSVEGPESTSTGSRSYFLFPRKRELFFDVLNNGDISVQTPGGVGFVFSNANARLKELAGGTFREDLKVSMGNNGGLEILSYPGLYLDTGWQLGEVAYSKPKRTSVFKDPHGGTCTVTNGEVFDYIDGEPSFHFGTDQALATFLAKRCPGLDLNSLK